MKSLLLVAHGSRREPSNEEVRDVARSLSEQVKDQYAKTECAFLELANPSIPEGIEELIRAGSKEVIILPYFLSAGRHVHEDVPDIVQAKQKENPDIKITIAPYLGEADQVIDVLAMLSSQVSAEKRE